MFFATSLPDTTQPSGADTALPTGDDVAESPTGDNDAAGKSRTSLKPLTFQVEDNDVGIPRTDNDIPPSSDNTPALAPLNVLPAGTAAVIAPGPFSVFIDVTTEPFSATIFLDETRLGLAPFKTSIMVSADKVYELYADFELRDLTPPARFPALTSILGAT